MISLLEMEIEKVAICNGFVFVLHKCNAVNKSKGIGNVCCMLESDVAYR